MNDIHERRQKSLHTWRQLWNFLVFIIGIILTGFLSFAIISAVNGSWIESGMSTLGTIVSGTAMNWLLKRRNEAAHEEEQGYLDYRNAEKQQQDRERQNQGRTGLLGRLNTQPPKSKG